MKSLDILEAVARAGDGCTVAALAAELEISRPTAHRITLALEARGYLRTSPSTKNLHLGPNLFELARKAWADVDLRSAAIDPMKEIALASRAGVLLAIPAGDRVVIIDRVTGATGEPMPSVGESIPMYDTAMGIAIRSVSQNGPMLPVDERNDGKGISPAAGLLYAAQLANARGYALQTEPGMNATTMVAAPVVDAFGNAIAAIAVVPDPLTTQEDDLHRLAPLVMEAARKIRSNAGVWLKPTRPHPKPNPGNPAVGTCLSNPHLLLPRSALLLPGGSTIAMVDVLRPAFVTYDLSDAKWTVHQKEALAGALAVRTNGALVIADQRGIWEFENEAAFGRRQRIAELPSTLSHSRFNTAMTAPDGSVWFGTMDLDVRHGVGDIWRLSDDGLVPLGLGLTTPSGIGFSPDCTRAYIVDSERHEILSQPLDTAGLPVGKPRSIARFRPAHGKPDALAVDRNGDLWVTFWDGWKAEQLDEHGRTLNSFNLPVPRASAICLDEANSRMYLAASSARLSVEALGEHPYSGGLLEITLA
jgi:DNA-binding IclR family transcriptional regulator/sugar lactone lactonase YvrE